MGRVTGAELAQETVRLVRQHGASSSFMVDRSVEEAVGAACAAVYADRAKWSAACSFLRVMMGLLRNYPELRSR